MHVGMPARSLVPTVDAPVLLALHATTGRLTGRRLATLAGASHTAVNAILARLTHAGIVLAERHGSAVLYRGNRDHVGWAVVEALAGLRQAALNVMRAELDAWEVPPVSALCFGSFARGDGDEDSDIDVLLIRPPDVGQREETWDLQRQALRERVHRTTGNDCQVLDIDLERLLAHVELDDPLVSSWRDEGVLLAGMSLRVAIARARKQAAARR